MIEDLIEKIREYGLTPEQYELCLSDAYQKANHTIDLEWQEIIDKYGLDIHYDTLRKATQTIFGGAFVSEYFKSKQAEKNNDSYLDEIRAEKQEIRKEKQRLFDERTALNKTLRENARIEEDLSKLEVLIKNNGAVTLPKVENIIDESDNDLFIALSDFHLGIKTDNYFGSYDSDIAAQRLSQYLDKIIKIKELHNSENAYILLLGDSKYEVGYIVTRTEGVKKISFNNKKLPKDYYITQRTVDKDEEGMLTPFVMTAYKASIQRSFDLSFSSEGDPASVTLTFDLMEDKDGNIFDMVELTEDAE